MGVPKRNQLLFMQEQVLIINLLNVGDELCSPHCTAFPSDLYYPVFCTFLLFLFSKLTALNPFVLVFHTNQFWVLHY